jgi:ubiquinone/menaquinone biosynthesis C-methylase UbiE
MAVDSLLRYDAFAWHYEASVGDHAYDGDLAWYPSRIPQMSATVLELACGTGRVALSLARAGLRVIGLDLSEPMLRIARRKAALSGLADRVTFVQGDMQDFALQRRFGTICIPYASFSLLLTARAQNECLAAVRRHLTAGGRLLMDMNFFDTHAALSASRFRQYDAPAYDPDRNAWISRRADAVRMRDGDVIEYEFTYRCQFENGTESEECVPFAFHTLSPIELIRRLESNRFEVIEASNGPDGRAFRIGDRRVFIAAVAAA